MPVSIEVEGLGHGAVPIPMAAMHRGILFTGGIIGKNIRTQEIPDGFTEEWSNCLDNLEVVLKAADLAMDDLVMVEVYLSEERYLPVVNEIWAERFPDPLRRPARHAQIAPLIGEMRVQLVATAVSAASA